MTSSRRAHDILRAYGCLAPTVAEQRAYVGVLDRMGAFASSQREILRQAGFLADDRAEEAASEASDHHRPRTAP